MPRLHPRIFHQARKTDPLLPLLLLTTRDLTSAKNELRWLKEFITTQHASSHTNLWTQQFKKVCIDRSRGKPLQYILGSEYFGDLEIACEKGVLIPRQETAASVTHLINRLHQGSPLPKHLKVLDLCTGTGCIPLLTYYEFCNKYKRSVKDIEVVGVDISPSALALANKNLDRSTVDGMIPPQANLQFMQADILASKDDILSLKTALQHYKSPSTSTSSSPDNSNWDILISNPPYISPLAFSHTTTRSVKKYEPLLALVPPTTTSLHPSAFPNHPPSPDQIQADTNQGDLFYPHLLHIATAISAKIILFEVADLEQARRVAVMAEKQGVWHGIEIWRDDPCNNHEEGLEDGSDGAVSGECAGEMVDGIKVLGRGNARTVVAYRGKGKEWMCAKA